MISKGNYVNFARFVLLAVSEEAKTFFFFVQCIVKLLLDSASADNPYLDLDYSGWHKNSYNNCLLSNKADIYFTQSEKNHRLIAGHMGNIAHDKNEC